MIGIFDSGSGGLSVLRALRRRAPSADIVYFGDLKNVPYGNKNREELGALTVLGIQKLIDEGATEIVSACNSVSVSIVLPMFDILRLPRTNMIEMVGPTVASLRQGSGDILVVATQATVESGVYQEGLRKVGRRATGVALPALVDLIENDASASKIQATIREGIEQHQDLQPSQLVLGCTHFPLVRQHFEAVLKDLLMQTEIIDPAEAVTELVLERFTTTGSAKERLLVSAESTPFATYAGESSDATVELVDGFASFSLKGL